MLWPIFLLIFICGDFGFAGEYKCNVCTQLAAPAQYSFVHFSDFVKSSVVAKLPNNTVKVSYVPSARGTNVIYAKKDIPDIYKNEAMMEFEVFFDKDFEWVKGGKMHGFLSGSPSTISTGCVTQPKNGWSYRTMWRRDGRISIYIYDQSRITNGENCGNNIDSAKNILTKNRWINIKLYMKLNSKGDKADGVAKLYVDNVLVLQRQNIQFRGVDSGATIDFVSFTTFYGGHDATWSPSKTTYALYRGVKMHSTDLGSAA